MFQFRQHFLVEVFREIHFTKDGFQMNQNLRGRHVVNISKIQFDIVRILTSLLNLGPISKSCLSTTSS